jgi:hypothetical protein
MHCHLKEIFKTYENKLFIHKIIVYTYASNFVSTHAHASMNELRLDVVNIEKIVILCTINMSKYTKFTFSQIS